MKRVVCVFASLILVVFLFSGCASIGIGAEQVMSPPGTVGIRNEVRKLLLEVGGNDVSLYYPKAGSYRSAIITSNDFTGDRVNDVVAFCSSSETGSLSVVFISQTKSGELDIISNFDKNYSIVDRVYFEDLDGDGNSEIIVGWGSPINMTSNICIYSYNSETGKIRETDLLGSYSEMAVGDFLRSGSSEIFVFTLSKTQSDEIPSKNKNDKTPSKIIPAYATLYDYDGKDSVCLSSVELDPSSINYSLVTTGKSETSDTFCILDCFRADKVMFTQIVYWNDVTNAVSVYPSLEEISGSNETNRASVVYSQDINEDGLIEIPSSYTMPFVNPEFSSENSYQYSLLSWNRFDMENSKLLLVSREYANYKLGYKVKIPIDWGGKVAIFLEEGVFAVYEWDNGAFGDMIYKITTTFPEISAEKSYEYVIYSSADKRHIATIGESKNVRIDIQTLKTYFDIIT